MGGEGGRGVMREGGGGCKVGNLEFDFFEFEPN